jgi:hypothetical protein
MPPELTPAMGYHGGSFLPDTVLSCSRLDIAPASRQSKNDVKK